MKTNRYIVILWFLLPAFCVRVSAQTMKESYDSFRRNVINDYKSFRYECNQKYLEFLKEAWDWYEGKTPLPHPKDERPVPPKPYLEDREEKDSTVNIIDPVEIIPEDKVPQPKPIEPIRENIVSQDEYFRIDFFGVPCEVRLPEGSKSILKDFQPNSIASAWERLSTDDMNNAIRDCLETRIRYNLCDWAYMTFLDQLSRKYCTDTNSAVLLMAFLYSQSGYQMRLAVEADNNLVMLFGSKHQIFDKTYYDIDGTYFYPLGDINASLRICKGAFEGETPLSLRIYHEQLFADQLSQERIVASKRYGDVSVGTQVPVKLIDFYNCYPTAAIDGNPMTRWAMYANTPLAGKTKDAIYPKLRASIDNCSELAAANKLLNWVQTGFVYEYDDKVWGYDRAFFAEESLYYPYCDCEDRSILFSRLVRDLLGLDVALIYYPGHLATAVCFNEDIKGDAIMIGGRKFIVCDPTYIGAPVGVQMPDLEYDRIEAIVLEK